MMHVVKEKETAQYLLDINTRRFLVPFLKDAIYVTQAAHALNMSETDVRNRVRKLSQMGILNEVGSARVNGRAMKMYQAVAEQFQIPFDLSPYTSLAELMFDISHFRILCDYYEVCMNAVYKGDWYIILYPDYTVNDHILRATFNNTEKRLETPFGPVWHGTGRFWRLSFADAKALTEELTALETKYQSISDTSEGQQEYYYHMHFLPRSK
jgi:biotin operon repressor